MFGAEDQVQVMAGALLADEFRQVEAQRYDVGHQGNPMGARR
jgi:hypothetical protein